MPFKRTPPTRAAEIRDLAEDWGKVIARRAFGEGGSPDEVDFDTFEQIAVDAAQALTKGTIEQLLQLDAQRPRRHGPLRRTRGPLPGLPPGFFSLAAAHSTLIPMATARPSSGRS